MSRNRNAFSFQNPADKAVLYGLAAGMFSNREEKIDYDARVVDAVQNDDEVKDAITQLKKLFDETKNFTPDGTERLAHAFGKVLMLLSMKQSRWDVNVSKSIYKLITSDAALAWYALNSNTNPRLLRSRRSESEISRELEHYKLSTPDFNAFNSEGAFRYLQHWIPEFFTFLNEAAKVKLPADHIIYSAAYARSIAGVMSDAEIVAEAMVDNKDNGKPFFSFR